MKILFISDWHGENHELPDEVIDLVVVLGDMEWRRIVAIDRRFSCPKLGLLGNHDRIDLYKNTKFIDMHKNTFEMHGLKFAGFEGCPRYNTKNTPQYEEEDVAAFCETLEGIDIFLAHANPMLEGNFDPTDAHRGFLAFTEYIVNKQPRLFVHGHLHEMKKEALDDTTILSVYPYLLLTI